MHMRRLFWLQMGACSTYLGEYYYMFLWLVCLFFEGFGFVIFIICLGGLSLSKSERGLPQGQILAQSSLKSKHRPPISSYLLP